MCSVEITFSINLFEDADCQGDGEPEERNRTDAQRVSNLVHFDEVHKLLTEILPPVVERGQRIISQGRQYFGG
jgi:hypothetical protein